MAELVPEGDLMENAAAKLAIFIPSSGNYGT
jgi:hypothetical protein